MSANLLTQAGRTGVEIPGPCGQLEAAVMGAHAGAPLGAAGLVAIVCHPHPLHGGTMDNKVVTTLARTYRELGIPAVTFNFRGVGRSAGAFDNAVGEVEDLLAVAAWVRAQYPAAALVVAGFSFGSSVAAQGAYYLDNLRHLTLVAPPVERYAYDRDKAFPCPLCVIQGGADELVDVPGVYRWVDGLKGEVDLIRLDSASHFFHGELVTLKAELSDILLRRLGTSC